MLFEVWKRKGGKEESSVNFYGARAKAKSGDLAFTYLLEIFLEDVYCKPVDGAKCEITFADSSVEEGVLPRADPR